MQPKHVPRDLDEDEMLNEYYTTINDRTHLHFSENKEDSVEVKMPLTTRQVQHPPKFELKINLCKPNTSNYRDDQNKKLTIKQMKISP